MPVIEGIAKWASLSKPNPRSGKYQIDVCHLTPESIAKLKADGVTTLHTDKDKSENGKGAYITLKQSAVTKAGKEMDPPKVVDAHKNPLPRGTLIGNGSRVKAVYDPFAWNVSGKSGVSAGLRVVQVIELVSYGGNGVDELDEVDGFVADTAVDELEVTTSSAAEEEVDSDDIPF